MYCLTFKVFCYSDILQSISICQPKKVTLSITIVLKLKGSTILCLTQIERIKSLIYIKVYRDFKLA